MRSDGARNASGYALHGPQPKAREGRVPSPDDFDVWRQDDAKARPAEYDRPESRSAYNNRPQSWRP
jgi:hypothetical protein